MKFFEPLRQIYGTIAADSGARRQGKPAAAAARGKWQTSGARKSAKQKRGTMAEKNKRGFHTIEHADMEEYEAKLRVHRGKIIKRTVIAIAALAVAAAGFGLFLAVRHYENFEVLQSAPREDTEAAHVENFKGNILKYSNDGAFYTNAANELIWNQTYEMADPKIDICEDYLTIYDRKGNMIYILTSEGLQGSIETTMPIEQVCAAAQGTIAVLMTKDSVGYVALYDRSGKNLVQGAIHGEKKGYPIAIALSQDAIKLAVSMLDINDGSVKSTIAFYNFGSVGENEIDHVVGANSFEDTVIPEIKFASSDTLMALSDKGLLYFKGAQKPQQSGEVPFEKEVKSIFYNQNYIGVVTSGEGEEASDRLCVYDMGGSLVMEKDFAAEYTEIEFLPNNEICIRNENICDIYSIRGIYKFHYEFEETIYKVIPGTAYLNYTFVLKDTTEKVRLK